MSTLLEFIADERPVAAHRPWPRAVVTSEAWRFAGGQLSEGTWTLVDLWAEPTMVHVALFDEAANAFGVISHDARSGSYPSIGAMHPPARRFERTIFDLFGLAADGAADLRPWLDHGVWGIRAPLGPQPVAILEKREPYTFNPVEGEGIHQIPVGPVHAGIIEPGHFRFSANGEAVVRLEQRLGYVHRGLEFLLVGAPIEQAARIAARGSGDSTVAYSLAFSQAIESACATDVPARARWLRALMLELERIANHFGDVGAVCNDAAFSLMHAYCGVLRERTLRAAHAAFGHRLMMDRTIPGGVSVDLKKSGTKAVRKLIAEARRRLPSLLALYDETTSLQDRTVATGKLSQALAKQFGAGGYVGRASGRAFDARKSQPASPYDRLDFTTAVSDRGDVDARVRIRLREIVQSLDLLEKIIESMPDGAIASAQSPRQAEGVALVEGFRGDVFAWVRLNADGTLERARVRDPSCFQWPLLEAAIEGNIVADFPLCNKSFNCSYAGHDL